MPSVFIITDSSCTGTNQLERIGPLLTHENSDFGAISVTERSCAAPILKVVVTYRMGFCATPVADPDLQIRCGGGGWGGSQKKLFRPFRPQFELKNKRPPPPSWIRHCTLSRSVNRYIHTLYLVAFTACRHEKLPSKVQTWLQLNRNGWRTPPIQVLTFFPQPRPQGAFPWLWRWGGKSAQGKAPGEKRPGNEIVFPYKCWRYI